MGKDCKHGKYKMLTLGIGLLVFGGVKYLGYSWEMALMVIGVLAILKGLLIMAMNK